MQILLAFLGRQRARQAGKRDKTCCIQIKISDGVIFGKYQNAVFIWTEFCIYSRESEQLLPGDGIPNPDSPFSFTGRSNRPPILD